MLRMHDTRDGNLSEEMWCNSEVPDVEEYNTFGGSLALLLEVLLSFPHHMPQMSSTQQYPPLTTVFTPPSQCSMVQITALEDNFLWQDLGLVFDFYNKSKKQDDAEFYCYPSGNYQNQLAFSPGISCPHGYTEFTTLPIATSVSDHHDELTKFCCPK